MNTTPGPHSDADTFDVLDDALAELATRRGVWLGDELAVIGLLADLIDQGERCLPEPVSIARANGHSWVEIGQLLGTSPEQARLRFDPDSPIADGRWPYDTS
jgi:hypothetical protein